MQGMPVQFNAGRYLEDDYSILDGLDAIELYEFRENITAEVELRKKEFHAATKLLAEKQKQDAEALNSTPPDPNPTPDPKTSQKASKEADSSHNPT